MGEISPRGESRVVVRPEIDEGAARASRMRDPVATCARILVPSFEHPSN
jgi:hypothetical protein